MLLLRHSFGSNAGTLSFDGAYRVISSRLLLGILKTDLTEQEEKKHHELRDLHDNRCFGLLEFDVGIARDWYNIRQYARGRGNPLEPQSTANMVYKTCARLAV